jgi:hypothetical protein
MPNHRSKKFRLFRFCDCARSGLPTNRFFRFRPDGRNVGPQFFTHHQYLRLGTPELISALFGKLITFDMPSLPSSFDCGRAGLPLVMVFQLGSL